MVTIYDQNGNFDYNQVAKLRAKMLYPKDENKQRALVVWDGFSRAGEAAKRYQELNEDKVFFSSLVDLIIDSGGLQILSSVVEISSKEIDKLIEQGVFAGYLVKILVNLQIHKKEETSMNKALFIAASKLGRTDRTIRTYWNKYKNVSHLWAGTITAFQLINQGLVPEGLAAIEHSDELISARVLGPKASEYVYNHILNKFTLYFAYNILKILLDIVPQGSTKPLFSSEDFLEISEDTAELFQKCTMTIKARTPDICCAAPTNQELEDLLPKYKAPSQA